MIVSYSWNVRGFNNKIKRRSFLEWLKETRPLFGSITETRIRQENFEDIRKEFPDWNIISNYEFNELGRIWVLWRTRVKLTVVSKTMQTITCLINMPHGQEVLVSFIYGANCRYIRQELWNDLRSTSLMASGLSMPWTVLGDFNEILEPSETSSYITRINSGMRDFRQCVQDSDLLDLPYRGPDYTWWNNQASNTIAKKLDRVLANEEWRDRFPLSYTSFDSFSFSDHRPGILHMGARPASKAPFKVANYLLDHPLFLDTLAQFWESTHYAGSAMYCLTRKLKDFKQVLKTFNTNHYSGLEHRVAEAHLELKRTQDAFIVNPSSQAASNLHVIQRKWWLLAEAEEKFLKQRARVRWLKEGDLNTKFFHKSIQARRAINHIHYLQHQGIRLETKEAISDHAVNFFTQLLGEQEEPLQQRVFDKIRAMTKFRCEEWMKEILNSDVSATEIQQVVFNLPRMKCPGPDGYTSEFYVRSWSIVGDDLIRAVQEFFQTGQLLKQLNATHIALIPKVKGADCLSNFRPISLCNVLYKVISTIITRRLQITFPSFISPSQTAFVKGRSIIENVILATELVKGFGSKANDNRGALKVDISKAFDKVRWDFIIAILEAADFPPMFVSWISQCISTTSYSLCINGEPCGFFKGKRGLRQGDPLSPALFIIAMEMFGALLKSEFEEGNIVPHDLCVNPLITHLSFADDIMVFFDGKADSLKGIKKVFDEFRSMSGLGINMAKTTAYIAGSSSHEKIRMMNLGFNIGTLPVRYLGLPLLTRKMRQSDYTPLLEAVSKRLSSWTTRFLSFAGRLQLLSSVIYSITNYWMGAFLIPKGCLREISKLCMHFLWSGDIAKTGKAKVSWKTVCLPKDEGGLGLRDFSTWNTNLQLKLIWILFTKEDSLWVAWTKNHWLKRHNFWTTQTTSTASWVWRSILNLRPLAKRLLSCRIGNGMKASFWHDIWNDKGPLIEIMGQDGPLKIGIPADSTVAQASCGHKWRLPTSAPRCPRVAELTSILLKLQPPMTSSRCDQFLWGNLTTFSSKLTWHMIRPSKRKEGWTRLVWTKSSIPKHAFLVWLISLDRLPLRSRLHRWGLNVVDLCCTCSSESEDRDHLFLRCEFAHHLWDWIGKKLRCECVFSTWHQLLTWIQTSPSRKEKILRTISSQTTLYAIWNERNSRLHKDTATTTDATIAVIDKTVRATLLATRSKKLHKDLLSFWFIA